MGIYRVQHIFKYPHCPNHIRALIKPNWTCPFFLELSIIGMNYFVVVINNPSSDSGLVRVGFLLLSMIYKYTRDVSA